jgi:hypothetical protein
MNKILAAMGLGLVLAAAPLGACDGTNKDKASMDGGKCAAKHASKTKAGKTLAQKSTDKKTATDKADTKI